MHKTFRLAAAAMAIALTACTQNEVLQDTSSTNLIGFGTYAGKSTKAGGTYVTGTTFADDAKFGVMAYKTAGAWATDGASATPAFMFNQAVTVTNGTAGTCTYSPAKYWPITSKLSFLAYYPHEGGSNNTGITLKESDGTAAYSENSKGLPKANFTVKDAAADQVDFMYTVFDNTKDRDRDKTTNGRSTVALNFKHALTRVKFQAKLNKPYGSGTVYANPNIIITGIKLEGVNNKGTFTFGETEGSWGTPTGTASYNFASLSKALPAAGTATNIADDIDSEVLLMIPQDLTNVKIVVSYTQDDEKAPDVELALSGTTAWTMNRSMLYTLILDPGTASSPISFTATTGVWDSPDTPVTPPTKMTATDFIAAVDANNFPEAVDITDASLDNNAWNALKDAIDKYTGTNTLDLTMSKLTGNIRFQAFQSCDALTSFYAPNITGNISSEAFHGCNALTSFSAPNMTGDISSRAFHYCPALESLSLPKMTGDIWDDAFSYCDALTSITLGGIAANSNIRTAAFNEFDTIGNCDLIFTATPKGTITNNKWTVNSDTWTFKSITVVPVTP